jgi:hypothetical protein
MEPLDPSALESFGAAIRKRQGFRVDLGHLAVSGLCALRRDRSHEP